MPSAGTSNGLSSILLPRPANPYTSDSISQGRLQLPAVSAIQPRREHQNGPDPRSSQYSPISYPSSYQDPNYPSYTSDINPSVPAPHAFHPAQAGSLPYSSQYRADPQLVTLDNSQSPRAPLSHTPPVQRRLARKISQRKADTLKVHVHVNNRSSASLENQSREQQTQSDAVRENQQPTLPMLQERPPQATQSKPIPISGLLSGTPSGNLDRPPPTYSITVRQQPKSARACGFGERDRRVIDPPPILVLGIDQPGASPEEITAKLRSSLYVVHCSLWNPVTDEDETMMAASDRKPQRRLVGTLVGAHFYGKDTENREQCFFHFTDLSVRTAGTYYLKFKLVVLDAQKMKAGFSFPICATTKSEPFAVYNAKDFKGMRASTELTKCLKAQGCLIPVKKGNATTNASTPHSEEEVGNPLDDEDHDGSEGSEITGTPKRIKCY